MRAPKRQRETLPESERARWRVVNPREDALARAHSTRTYPNVTMGVPQGAEPGAAHQIARTLLTMPKLADGSH